MKSPKGSEYDISPKRFPSSHNLLRATY